jgi:arylsulfatase A-like enzyme
MCLHIQDEKRRAFANTVTAMDEAIGNITTTFQKHGLWENTLMIFTTDNGGPVTEGANNYPLRGSKHTLWEGGTRGSVFVYGSMLEKTGYVNNELVHSVDWYPTLMTVAEVPITDTGIDGMDMWDTISKGMPSKRDHFVYNIDTNIPVAAIRYKQWKLIVGDPGSPSGWYPQPNASIPDTDHLAVTDNTTTYLFDLDADPTEHFNVAEENTDVVAMMKMRLQETMKTYVHDLSTLHPPTAKSNPANFGDAWSPGWC